MKCISFTSMAIVALLASCSSDMEQAQTDGKFDGKVTLSAPAYELEDGTRTTLTSSESGISFAWDDDETIGIFPIAPTTNAQAYQKLNGGSGDGTKSSFDGAGWALLRGNTYAAYYPFQDTKATTPYTSVPIDMTGQTQDGNGSLAHIGAGYDYMYATASVPKNGDVSFDYKHVCSIVKLELTMPVAATLNKVELLSGNNVFITKATMNASTGAIVPVTMASSIVLNLCNVNTYTTNQKLELYLAALPTTTGELTIKVSTSANCDYTATLSSKTLKAGKAHLLVATLVAPPAFTYDGMENGHAYVDLGLRSGIKWATMNVGATSPEGSGNYYAWGETEPQSIKRYDWETYKWCNGSQLTITKYCTSSHFGTVDNKTTLEAEDDAASVNWGGTWRMPTLKEQAELQSYCYWVWTNSYNGTGKAGYIIYKAKSSSDEGEVVTSGNTPSDKYSLSDTHIFLPAASIDMLWADGDYSIYWGSSGERGNYWMSFGCDDSAYFIYFDYTELCGGFTSGARCNGFSVRAVCK